MSETTILLSGLANIFMVVLFIALLYVIGTMGDNIKRIRKMLEDEIDRQRRKA